VFCIAKEYHCTLGVAVCYIHRQRRSLVMISFSSETQDTGVDIPGDTGMGGLCTVITLGTLDYPITSSY